MDAFPALALRPAATSAEALHPALWRAHQLGRERLATRASGFAELDAELPGGGWPTRALTELLLPGPGIGELRLLAPALAAVQEDGRRCVMLVDPPAALCAPAWQALGLSLAPEQLVIVQRREQDRGSLPGRSRLRERLPAADMLWALEQALASGHLGALLAWLPARLPTDALRRLQLAAQAHDGPVFLLREAQAQRKPSPAPLRLVLAPAGADALQLKLIKRRGPPPAQPLVLALAPVLSASAAARARAQRLPGVAAASAAARLASA